MLRGEHNRYMLSHLRKYSRQQHAELYASMFTYLGGRRKQLHMRLQLVPCALLDSFHTAADAAHRDEQPREPAATIRSLTASTSSLAASSSSAASLSSGSETSLSTLYTQTQCWGSWRPGKRDASLITGLRDAMVPPQCENMQ